MTLEEFERTLPQAHPPAGLGPSEVALRALWHEHRGDWAAAHGLAQDDTSREGSWVHAYLHRKEGDIDNARYWYGRAGRELPNVSLDQEWRAMVSELLLPGGTP